MISVSGAQLPLPGSARAPQSPAASAVRDPVAMDPPSAHRVARIRTDAGQAHAVFSYGHTAQLNHSDRLGTQLDVHA